jgi:hypothetical protein
MHATGLAHAQDASKRDGDLIWSTRNQQGKEQMLAVCEATAQSSTPGFLKKKLLTSQQLGDLV